MKRKIEYEEPHEDAVADARLYARLQREAQAREDLAQTAQLSSLIAAPRHEPRFVDGRWVS